MKIDNVKLDLHMARNCIDLKELSLSSGVGTATLCRIRKGVQAPTCKTIGKIAKALNVDVTEIVVVEGRKDGTQKE